MSLEVPRSALPSRKLRMTVLYLLSVPAALALLLFCMDMSPSSFMVDSRFVADFLRQMFPPNFSLYWTKNALFVSILETLAMSFLGTAFGGAIALVLAFLAASNTTPNKLLRLLTRTLLAINRSLPPLILILIILVAVGIGPFAGVLALTLNTIGTFGKLFADTLEQADKGVAESVQSVGATDLQVIHYAILPQIIPSFIANLFYAFDVNLRAAIPMGIFGGGGIGFELEFANGLLKYHDVIAYTLLIIAMITVMERISDWARRTILAHPGLTTK